MENAERPQPILVQYILERVNNYNKNFLIPFIGPTGSGKSYAAMKLGECLDPTFNVDKIAFRAIDFMNIVNGLVEKAEQGETIRGKVIMWDEMGVEHNAKSFMSISNRVLNYFFQTCRHLNLVLILTVPLLNFIDASTRKLCHATAEMQGINTHDKTATVKVRMIQTNVLSGKSYIKYIRYRRKNKQRVTKRIKFGLPSKELLDAYEKKKIAFTSQLNKEIMGKLLKSEEKKIPSSKQLTPSQRRVVELLKNHNVQETSEILGINLRNLYVHKSQITKKGVLFKPIRKDNRVVAFEVEGFDENVYTNHI